MPIPRTTQRRSQPQLTSQAQINAVLRYAPERQALAQAVQEARSQHTQDIAGAQSEARLNQSAVNGAVPVVQDIYGRDAASASTARSALAATLAGLGGGATPFAAAAATEGAVGAEKTAREQAAAEAQLHAQALAIHAAPAFARTLADNRLGTTLSKILASTEGVAGQEGLATASEAQREAKEKQAKALTERGQNITAKSDAEGHAIAQEGNQITAKHYAESGGPNGVKLQTSDKQAAAAEQVRALEGKVRQLWKTHTPQQIYAELTTTHPASTENVVKRDENGKPIYKVDKAGNKTLQYEAVHYGEIKPSNALFVQAALDSALKYGTVSKATLAKLHEQGYSIKELNLKPPKAGANSSPPTAPAGRGNERRSTASR